MLPPIAPAPTMPMRIRRFSDERADNTLSIKNIFLWNFGFVGLLLIELGSGEVGGGGEEKCFDRFSEQRPVRIFFGDSGDRERPAEFERRIVVAEAAFVFRAVEFADLIEDFGVVRQRLISVSAERRDVECAVIFGGEFDGEVFEKTWRIGSKIDDDVVDGTAGASDQFGFGCWRNLVMHSSKDAFFFV